MREVIAEPGAAEPVHHTEWHLARAQELAGMGSYEWDLRTNTHWRSDNLYRLAGTTREAVAGRDTEFISWVHPEDRLAYAEAWGAALANGTPMSYEYRFVREDGAVRFVHVLVEFERDERGDAVKALGVVRDITEQKQAQAALEASEERFRLLADSARDVIWTMDAEGRLTYISPSVEAALGYTPAELLRARFFDGLVAPASLPAPQAFGAAAFAGERDDGVFEVELRARDGSVAWGEVSIVVLRDDAGRVTAFSGVSRDVTKRKQAEEELQRRADFERALAEISARFVNVAPDDFDATVAVALAQVGEFLGADNVSLRLVRGDSDALVLRHRWLDTGMEAAHPLGHQFTRAQLPWFFSRLDADQAFHVNSLDDMPPDAVAERRVMEAEGEQAGMVVPLRQADGLAGALFIFTRREPRAWSTRDLALVRFVGDIFINALSRKQVEEQLQLLLHSTAEAIYGLDLEGNCTFANLACARMLGYTGSDALLGRNMHDLIHHSHADGTPYPVHTCRIYQTFRQGEGTHVDDEVLWRADGSSFPAEYWSYPLERDGEVLGSVVTFVDISVRRRAEDALRQQAQIIDQIHDAVISTDLAGYVTSWNKGAERLFGYTTAEASDRHISFVYPEDEHAFLADEVIAPLKAKGEHEVDVRMRRKSGEDFFGHLSLSLLRDSAGAVAGMIGYSLDITERKTAEADLERRSATERLVAEISAEFINIAAEDFDRAFEWALGLVGNFLEADNTTVRVMAESGDGLRLTHRWLAPGREPFFPIGHLFNRTAAPWLFAQLEAESILHVNIPDNLPPVSEGERAALHAEGVYASTVVPLRQERVVAGVLIITQRHAAAPWSTHDLALVRLVGDILMNALTRQQGQTALRKSEQSLAKGQELAHVGSWEWDLRTDTRTRSAEVCRICGLEPDEMGAGIHDGLALIHPDDQARVMEAGITALLERGPEEVEYRIVRPDGSVRYVYDTSEFEYDADGSAIRQVGAMLDITDRRTAERALRANEARFRGAFERFAVGMTIVDVDGCYREVNDRFCQMVGYTREELIGRSVQDLAEPQQRTEVLQDGQDLFRGRQEELDTVRTIRTKDGSKCLVRMSTTVLRDEGGEAEYFLTGHEDITARRVAEQALRSSRQDLARAQEIAHVGSWVWEAESDTLRMSEENYRLCGLDPDTFDGTLESSLPCFHADDRAAVQACIVRAIRDREPQRAEVRVVLPDGTERHVRGQGQAEFDDDGRLVRVTGTTQDITSQKEIEAVQAKLDVQLRQSQKMESMGTLAGGIAHDFNNVLTGILGFSELVQSRLAPDSPEHEYILEVLTAADRARNLVAQILAFSRQTEGQRRPVELAPIVDEVLRLVRAGLPSTIDVQADLPAKGIVVQCDPTQIHQVLMNLCTNAGHAMHTGGVLELRLERLELDARTSKVFHDLEPGVYARLTVRDTGTGIEPGVVARIFEPYFTTKEVGEGTGLGLAVVHGIVKSMGGDIEVYTELGRGTEFQILLPAVNTRVQGTPLPPSKVPRGTEHVLLVDDEAQVRALVEATLTDLGYTVTTCEDGNAAIRLLEERADGIDLVLTDKTMPNMSGIALAECVKSRWPDLPVVLCTGFQDPGTQDAARRAGIRRVLDKPIRRAQLAQVLRDVLEQSK